MAWIAFARYGSLAVMALTAGCVTGPEPIVVYEDQRTSVAVAFDPRAESGHDHPVTLSPSQIARVLTGIRAVGKDVSGLAFYKSKESSFAFLPSQVELLSPHISQAFKKASPQDLVTFYLINKESGGIYVTSGGVFYRRGHLYVILANAHTSPSSVQYESAYEPNLRDQPLLPIARYKFEVSFESNDAWIPNSQAKKQDQYDASYVDEAKMLVIDLSRLPGEPTPVSPTMPSPAVRPR